MTKKDLNIAEAADIFEEIALFLELNKENPFKVKAFANGARILSGLSGSLGELLDSGTLGKTKGIGPGLMERLVELNEKSYSPFLEDLKRRIPESLLMMLKIPGLGPKKVRLIYDQLKIESLEDLEKACQDGRISGLKNFSEKSAQNILKGIAFMKTHSERLLYSDAHPQALALLDALKDHGDIEQIALAGSMRRCLETIKDIDLVASSKNPKNVMACFTSLNLVGQVTAHGETKSSVILKSGMRADLRVVSPLEFPFALMHFSGSKEHNTALRARAKHRGLKLNEYGLFDGDEIKPCQSESDIYKHLGLHFIPPELREDHGEILEAETADFHDLVQRQDLQGTFHAHSKWSDGKNAIEEMIVAAQSAGLKYLGITDHSQSAFYANGLKPDRVKKQNDEIVQLRKKFPNFAIYHGIESDILKDGALDYDMKTLEIFDFVIASVHGQFNLSETEMTQRLIRAIENPFTTMIGHLTGRLLLAREGFSLNMEKVIQAAVANDVVIEINANPRRLDLDWRWGQIARKAGLITAINPDAHEISGFSHLDVGVGIARKAGFRKSHVLNTRSAKQISDFFISKRKRNP